MHTDVAPSTYARYAGLHVMFISAAVLAPTEKGADVALSCRPPLRRTVTASWYDAPCACTCSATKRKRELSSIATLPAPAMSSADSWSVRPAMRTPATAAETSYVGAPSASRSTSVGCPVHSAAAVGHTGLVTKASDTARSTSTAIGKSVKSRGVPNCGA